MPHGPLSIADHIRPILGAVRAVPIPASEIGPDAPAPTQPFITISREPGAGARTLARRLADALNSSDVGQNHPWTLWDRELVEKVASDHNLSKELVASLEDERGSWLLDLLGGVAFSEAPEEARIYKRVAQTIRALAQVGRVVIVGRGGVFVTRDMPAGIHLRLTAPREWRIAQMAGQLGVSQRVAARRVDELEKSREAFLRRHWPKEAHSPLAFTLTINTALLGAEQIVAMITALVRSSMVARRQM